MNIFDTILALLGTAAQEYPFMVMWISGLVLCVMLLNLYYVFVAIFKFVGRW